MLILYISNIINFVINRFVNHWSIFPCWPIGSQTKFSFFKTANQNWQIIFKQDPFFCQEVCRNKCNNSPKIKWSVFETAKSLKKVTKCLLQFSKFSAGFIFYQMALFVPCLIEQPLFEIISHFQYKLRYWQLPICYVSQILIK